MENIERYFGLDEVDTAEILDKLFELKAKNKDADDLEVILVDGVVSKFRNEPRKIMLATYLISMMSEDFSKNILDDLEDNINNIRKRVLG